jgi:RluA family pseudouridine synthase
MKIPVLFEDEDLLIVNKPAGVPVHATVDPLRAHVQGILERERGEKLVLFHRLDLETTGVLILGRNPRINAAMTDMFRARDAEIKKLYWLVVDGRWQTKDRILESYIRKVSGGRYVNANKGSATEWAKTEFSVLASNGERSWLEARLWTGRTHQIRLHCQMADHPILGDRRYGRALLNRRDSMALHCRRLEFKHPRTRAELVVWAPLPAPWCEDWIQPFAESPWIQPEDRLKT